MQTALKQKNLEKYLQNFKIGDLVWIEKEQQDNYGSVNPLEFPFYYGQINNINIKNSTIEIKTHQKTETIKIKKEILFKKDYHENLDVYDISKKKNVTVVDFLNNVKNRFANKTIFTNVGKELLILNPFEEHPEFFTQKRMDQAIEVRKINKKIRKKNNKITKLKNSNKINIK